MPPDVKLGQRLSGLSPERRAVLEKLLSGTLGTRVLTRVGRRKSGDASPLSSAEQRLWFLSRLEPDSAWYNLHTAFRVQGELSADLLRRSLEVIVDRHEGLRTTYPSANGVPQRSIASSLRLEIPVADLSSPAEDREAAIERLLREEGRKGFDLEAGPLIRTSLLRLGPRDHILQVTLHHIIADGLSMQLLFREWIAVGIAMATGQTASLADLRFQYSDFAFFEQANAVRTEDLAFWRQKLAGVPPLLSLPADKPRPPVSTHDGGRHPVLINTEKLNRLRALSRQKGATLFVTVLAAFGVLLHRYAGSADISVGTPVAGRDHPDLENLIGCFVNTLVLRLNLAEDPSFLDLIHRVRNTVWEALEHQEVPFEKLVDSLQPPRSLSYNPIFQVIFNLQRDRSESIDGIESTPLPGYTGTTLVDLTLSLTESDGALNGYWEYSKDLFDESTISRLAAHFETLLTSILDDPSRRISSIPLLSAAERRRVLEEFNGSARAWTPELLPSMFEAQAARAGHSVAIVHKGATTTFGELNRRANQLAHRLRHLGVGRGSLVGVLMGKSVDLSAALLGILKTGGAYVPLDPEYPVERLRFVIDDAKLSLLLSEPEFMARLSSVDVRKITIAGERATLDTLSPDNSQPSARPEDPAYVIYTSGSTGKPKGVVVPHRALVNYLRWMQEDHPLNATDCILQRTSISFDTSIWELFSPLVAGARLVLPTIEEQRDTRRLVDLVREQKVTVIQFVPSLLRGVIQGSGLGACPSLRRIFCGGEPLPGELVQKLAGQVDAEIVNLYGPTETCIFSASHRCSPADYVGTVSLGRPIANTQLYVLDSRLDPVPFGIPGELYIGGAGVALGYLHRPELTAERFVRDPFVTDSESRLFNTGDLARRRSDGSLEFLGRTDHQVKLRGYRIELEEVECALRRSPDVADAAVLVREDGAGGQRLVAFVVAAEAASLRSEELRRGLRRELPDFMVPSHFVFLDALPLAPNGKADRGALPAEDDRRQELSAGYIPPADAVEARLARIWENLLGVSPVGRYDNFFDLGGHSLLAIRMLAEVERELSASTAVGALFEAPTLEQFAARLRDKNSLPQWSSLVGIQPGGRKTPFFCVHADSGRVFFYRDLSQRLGEDQPVYGFESLGLDGTSTPLATIEEMASHYIREMRDVQPSGPYLLGGFCFGAYIALEMAHQLQAAGESVPLLVSFNTDGGWKTVRSFRDSILLHRRQLLESGWAGAIRYVVERLGYQLYLFAGKIGRAKSTVYRALHLPLPDTVRGLDIRQLNLEAARNYSARSYKGKLIYFQGSEDRTKPPELFWGELVSELETYIVPGKHVDVLREPGAGQVADRLKSCFDIALAGSATFPEGRAVDASSRSQTPQGR